MLVMATDAASRDDHSATRRSKVAGVQVRALAALAGLLIANTAELLLEAAPCAAIPYAL